MRHPSSSTCSAPLALRDPGDLDRRILLAVAPVLALVRLVLVREALDLRSFRRADDPSCHRGGAELGGRGEHGLAVDQHHRPERDLLPSSRSTSSRSPSATRYCLPPVWMTAYMRDASSECFPEPGKDSGRAQEAQAASIRA